MLRLLTSSAVVCAVAPVAQAIFAEPNSPCATNCGNTLGSTAPDELVCSEGSYASNEGQLFQGCLECEMTSSYYSEDNHTDTDAMLYNLRYTTSYCLWGFPHNDNIGDTPCITSKACGVYQDAVQYKNLSTKTDSFEYCDSWPVGDTQDFTGCRECLEASEQYYLANFITVLQAGCEQKPVPGVTVAFDGQVFADDIVNIIAPTPTATVNPDWFDHGPLNLGAKVGIAVGAVVLFLASMGCCIVWNGKRKRKAFLREIEGKQGPMGWPSPQQRNTGWPAHQQQQQQTGEMNETRDTPLSQRPLRGWDDSPMTAHSESTFPRYFSPYSSQYNSPVSAQDITNNMQWPSAAVAASQNIGVAVGGQDAPGGFNGGSWDTYSPDTKCNSHGEEAYEMHHVDSAGGGNVKQSRPVYHEPPVLGHPGYGRSSTDSPPRQYHPEGEEGRGGYAL